MPRRSFVRALTGALTASFCSLVPAASAATPSATIAQRINAIRSARGLPPLRVVPGLVRAARIHSLTQARRDLLTHDGFAARLQNAGIAIHTAGENVAAMPGCGADAARETVTAWMASPPHRRNILSPRFRMIGSALVVRGACQTAYATAEFAG